MVLLDIQRFQNSIQQLHIGDYVGLILRREDDGALGDDREEGGVVPCHILERHGGVVVEVRRRSPDPAQRRNLEGVDVFERWIVDDSRNQGASRSGLKRSS